MSGLSRKFGTVSGTTPNNVAQGIANPGDIFQDIGAKLFGVVNIADLIDAAAGLVSAAPTLITNRLPDQITTTLSFAPTVHPNYPNPPGIINLSFTGDLTKAFLLNATIVMPIPTGGGPGSHR